MTMLQPTGTAGNLTDSNRSSLFLTCAGRHRERSAAFPEALESNDSAVYRRLYNGRISYTYGKCSGLPVLE